MRDIRRGRLAYGCSIFALSSALAGLPAGLLAQDPPSAVPGAPQPLWRSFVDGEGQYSDLRSFGGADAYIGLHQSEDDLVYANLRGVAGDDGYAVSNAGILYRVIDRDTGVIFGGNVFANVEVTASDNTFVHGSVGGEVMGENWEVRGNFYYPFDDDAEAPQLSKLYFLPGNELRMRAGEDRGLTGGDAEIGLRLPLDDLWMDGELRVFGGAYYFAGDGDIEDITGYEGRLEYRAHDLDWLGDGSRLTLFAGFTQDDRDETTINNPELADGVFFAGGRLRIPLQNLFADADAGRPRPLTALERRMEDPWRHRDNPLVLGGPLGEYEFTRDPETGVRLTQYVEVTGATPDLQALIDQYGPNTLVLANGDFAAGLNMADSQTWLSGGTTIPLVGDVSGVAFNYTGPGAPAVVNGDAAASVAMQSNDHLAGFTITGNTAGVGVRIAGGSVNSTAQLNTFDTLSGDGIAGLDGLDDIRIRDNTFIDIDGTAIVLGSDATNIQVLDNIIEAGTAAGIVFGDGATTSVIMGNAIADTMGGGIVLGSTASDTVIEDNNISGAVDGISIGDGADNVWIVVNRVDNVSGAAVAVGTFASNLLVQQNFLSNAAGGGIALGDNAGIGNSILLNRIEDIGGAGIAVGSNAAGVSVMGNDLARIGGDAISFGAGSGIGGQITIKSNTFADIIGNGITLGEQVENVLIQGHAFTGGMAGIAAGNDVKAVTIAMNSFTDTGGQGILFGDNALGIDIIDNDLDGAMVAGIQFGDDATDILLAGSTIEDTTGDAIRFGNDAAGVAIVADVSLGKNLIDGTTGHGIVFGDRAVDVTVTGNQLDNVGDGGIVLGADAGVGGTVDIMGNQLAGITGDGIALGDGAGGAIAISANKLTTAGGRGIVLGANAGVGGTVDIMGNQLSGITGDGIALGDGAGGEIAISVNTLTTVGGRGIVLGANTASGGGQIDIMGNTLTTVTGDVITVGSGSGIGGQIDIVSNVLSDYSGNGITLGNLVANVLIKGHTFSGGKAGILLGDSANSIDITMNVFDATGQQGIKAEDGATDIAIVGNQFSETNTSAIHFGNDANQVTIAGNAIQDAQGSAIRFGDDVSSIDIVEDATFGKNIFDGTTGQGVIFGDRAFDIEVSNAVLSDIGGSGIRFGVRADEILLAGNELTMISGNGILLGNDASDVDVQGNSLTDINDGGIRFGTNAARVDVSDNILTTVSGQGIFLESGANTVGIIANILTDIGVGDDAISGIRIGPSATGVTIQLNELDTVGGHAIDVHEGATTTLIDQNKVTSAGLNGIRVLMDSTGTTISGNQVMDVGRNGIIVFDGAVTTAITGNTVDGALGADSNGIVLSSTLANKSIDFTITGNKVSNVTNAGIQTNVGAMGTMPGDAVIADNEIENAGFGIVVGQNNENIVVQGNDITNVVGTDAIGAIGISITEFSSSVQVLDNTITDVGIGKMLEGAALVFAEGIGNVTVNGNAIMGDINGDIAFVFNDQNFMTDINGKGGAVNVVAVDSLSGQVCDVFNAVGDITGDGFDIQGTVGMTPVSELCGEDPTP